MKQFQVLLTCEDELEVTAVCSTRKEAENSLAFKAAEIVKNCWQNEWISEELPVASDKLLESQNILDYVVSTGFAKNIENGVELFKMDEGGSRLQILEIDVPWAINRDDYIESKLWSEEDIETYLQDRGYEGTQEQVDAVINTGYLKGLGECDDGDWEIISQACDAAGFPRQITFSDIKSALFKEVV